VKVSSYLTMAAPAPVQPAPVFETVKGTVKQVLSGDSVIVRGEPKGGPPPERQINFSSVSAPRLARRATNTASETQDEPFAWESREFLRQKVIGKEVIFRIDPKSKQLNRDYGTIFLGKDMETGINITELMIAEGWLTVRTESARLEPHLGQLEEQAKTAKKGRWAPSETRIVRKIKWNVENPRVVLDKFAGKKVPAIVEHVRDGSTVRAFLLPDFYHITLMISGIRSPGVHMDGRRADPGTPEALGEQAKYFTETRVLQRDIHIILETSNNNNLVGSIIHPSGNIAEALLTQGFAKCVDWSMTTVTGGPEKLRSLEAQAKQKRLRVWAAYQPSENQVSDKDKEFSGKVVEIVNSDALVILKNDGKTKKIFLASIRPPRLEENEKKASSSKVFRPLYDIPHMYEAREFLRKKLIDQKVKVTVDYIQPAQANYPEKTCCSVFLGDINVAEALVQRGLATVVRYRQDDDQRAAHYDHLLSAEAKAIKGAAGLHSKKKEVPLRFRDLTDPSEAKKNYQSLKRLGKMDAVPEFVASGSRIRVYVPKETCILTFLLAGIQCPRAPRTVPGGTHIPGEDFGEEAYNFTRTRILQRSVQVEVESMDKGGNFIGWLYYAGGTKNLSVELVRNGLSTMHSTAEASAHYTQIMQAEKDASSTKKNIWKNYVPVEKVEKQMDEISLERKVDYRRMVITTVTEEGKLYGQNVSEGPSIEKVSDSLQQALASNPPVKGAYRPKKGDVCAAKYIDGNWYRAKVQKVAGNKVFVFYLDFGNREVTDPTKCAQMPMGLDKGPYFAKEMSLALVKLYHEEDYIALALDAIRDSTEKEVLVNTEYKQSGTEYVTLLTPPDKQDLAKKLLQEGLVLVDARREQKFQSLLEGYRTAQDEAKKEHRGVWRYGDISEDDDLDR